MASISPHPLVIWITDKQYQQPRIIWSRRNYHERLNLRRIVSRQQVTRLASQIAPEREDMICEQN